LKTAESEDAKRGCVKTTLGKSGKDQFSDMENFTETFLRS
jgi:hypothetical protein